MAKRIDMSQINANMIQAAATQEATSDYAKVWDSEFPMFPTPENRKILVYFPEDFESRKVELLVHETRKGKGFPLHRCIQGLSDGFEAFGYTGSCPFCDATESVWDLYNLKLDAKARELGIDRENDTDDILKSTRETCLREMAVKNATKYIVFPIVVLPSDIAGNPVVTPEAISEPYYVMWRKERYDNMFSVDVLEELESPAGQFSRWSFTYDTKGKPANVRDSAKALKIKIIEKADQLAVLEPFKAGAEQLIAPFTVMKAVDNIKALNYYMFDDVVKMAETTVKATKTTLLALSPVAGAPAVAPTQPTLGIGTDAATAIAGFGQQAQIQQPTAPAVAQPVGAEVTQPAVAQPIAQPAVAQPAVAQPIAQPAVAQPIAQPAVAEAQPQVPTAPTFGGIAPTFGN